MGLAILSNMLHARGLMRDSRLWSGPHGNGIKLDEDRFLKILLSSKRVRLTGGRNVRRIPFFMTFWSISRRFLSNCEVFQFVTTSFLTQKRSCKTIGHDK